ncbi:restriction endonuclease subunit S [Flavobacterium sp. 22076]|uniref:restriction endonuclease subunit S n=1 Tax=unclassified Flavobacterium TaxID=196869 RepID=UPI003F87E48D
MIKQLGRVSLKQIIITQKGIKPSVLSKDIFEGSVPYLDINALETGMIREYTYKELGNIGDEQDIFVVWDGSRSGLCFNGVFGAIGSTIMRITPIGFLQKYLYYFIKSNFVYINGNTKGNSIPHVDPEIFFELKVPYLKISDQEKIVLDIENKIEKGLSILNLHQSNILNSLSETDISFQKDIDVRKSFENFKLSTLQKAFSGELSTQFRKISSKNKKIDQEDYIDYLTEFKIPSDWIWTNLKYISKIGVGATPKRGVKAYWGGKIPWVSSGELNDTVITKTKERITELGLRDTNLKILPKGTILMAMIGEGKTRGKVAILDLDACTNQNICSIALNDNIDPKFVFYYLQFRYKEIRNGSVNSRSSSSQSALNSLIVSKFNICLPSYEEQCFISSKIDQIFDLVNNLSEEFMNGLEELEKLERSILTDAYNIHDLNLDDESEQLNNLLDYVNSERKNIEEIRKEAKKAQVQFKKKHFMKNTKENIISELKKYAIEKFSDKNISNDDKIALFEEIQSIIPGMDFDDFSGAFQQLAQKKLHEDEPEPFFVSKSVAGKLYHKIN